MSAGKGLSGRAFALPISMPNVLRTVLLIGLLLGLSWTLQVRAAEPPASPEAPEHIQRELSKARLGGQERFRWFGLNIYSAQLWVGPEGFRAQAPEAAAFALDLRYARKLYGKSIAETSIAEIRKLGLGTPEQHQAWLAQLIKMFPDVEDGSRITGVFLPRQGARFYFNGKAIGNISDTAFARAFFAIWLDPKTSAAALRAALLANAEPKP